MDKKQVESCVFIGLVLATVGIFILSPAYPVSQFDLALNRFLDNYLFGNGYYKPSNYPFAAKITNIFSMITMIIGGVWMGVYCWKETDVSKISVLQHILNMLMWSIFMVLVLNTSIMPQEFKTPRGRSFGLTESFHNNPISFLFLIICKSGVMYIWFRLIIPITIRSFKKFRK